LEIYLANLFGSTFAFLPMHKANQKIYHANATRHCKIDRQQQKRKEKHEAIA
jgi:formate/nitrite transporter FocA (FNT family)